MDRIVHHVHIRVKHKVHDMNIKGYEYATNRLYAPDICGTNLF
jgi:hypothetical protein